MNNPQKQCELERKIFEYKLKEIKSWRTFSFIIEVNGKTVCLLNRKKTLVLVNEAFPTEFTNIEMHHVKKVITGAEIKIFSVREWYKKELKKLSQLMSIRKEELI